MMTGKHLDQSWRDWVSLNLSRGCDPEGMLKIMLLEHGFAVDSIRTAMGSAFPEYSALLGEQRVTPGVSLVTPGIDHAGLARARITRDSFRFASDKLQLHMLDDFLDAAECARLIEIIESKLRPSTITRPSSDPEFRTSTTCDLSYIDDPAIHSLDRKIAQALGISEAYGEGNQGQRYEVGQQFKPHTDYFQPDTPEYETFARARGNRTWTFMIYLNSTPKGGGTHFTEIDRVFLPRAGRALTWNNLNADGSCNPNTRHCGLPVEEGTKIIITKWFREKGAGPMLLDVAD